MSSYTTTLNEVMKDINKRQPKPIPELIEKSRSVIFDFDYDVPKLVDKEVFKKWFETTFLTKFALWEIGYDTYEQFHLQLWSKCSRIMPSYSIILDRIYSAQQLGDSAFYNIKKGNEVITERNKNNETSNNKNDTTSNNIHSTLPINMINASLIGDVNYADDGNKLLSNSSSQSNNNKTGERNETINYDLKMGCYIDSMSKFFDAFNKDVISATDKLFDEFNYLFLGVL